MLKAMLLMGSLAVMGGMPAHAEEIIGGSHFYVGGGVGQTNLRLSSTAFGDAGSKDEAGFKFTGGWQFHPYFALEGSYYNPGTFSENDGNDRLKVSADIFQLSAVGTFPIAGSLSGFGRVGVAHWNSKLSATVDGESGSLSADGNDFNWGIGVQAILTNHLSLRGEFEQTTIDQDLVGVPVEWRVRFIQIGAFYTF